MGLFDKIQGAAAGMAQQQSVQDAALLQTSFPGRDIARSDVVRISPRFRNSTVAAYIATLGLRPEDVYAVIPQHSNDVTVAFTFV